MELTTHLEHESQRTRLSEQRPTVVKLAVKDGILTLYDIPFQEIYTTVTTGHLSIDYNPEPRLGQWFSY